MSLAKTTAPATASASGGPDAADSKPKILLHPVPLVDSPLAKGLSFGRIAVLLGLLSWRMDSLIADPVSTLRLSLPVVAAIQVVYAIVCVPPAGSSQQLSKKSRPGEKKKVEAGPNSITSAIVALILTTITVPFVYVLFVLFGAPFLDHTSHTVLLGAHFSLLAVFPVLHARGLDRQAFITVAGAAAPLDETFGGLAGAVVGAWLGAVPIPLDWDRDWQRWPVTIVVGVYLGAVAGSLLAGTVLYGKRLASPAVKAD